MANLTKNFINLLLLFFVFTPSTGEIKSFKIQSDDQEVIVLDKFEFTHTGHTSVSISSVSITSYLSPPADPSRFGFFLVSDDAIDYMYYERMSCYLDSRYIKLLFTLKDLPPPHASFNKSYNVTYPNSYSLRFANCNPLTHVTMDTRTELYNTDIDGNTKDYLSAGQTKLPRFYFKFSIIYLCCLGLWIYVCFMNRNSSLHWIHILMGVLLLMKGLNLLFAAKVEHSFKVTGTPPHHGLYYAFLYVFLCIKNVLFYTVIAVIIDGCCFLKRDVPVTVGLLIVIPLQIFATIASKLEREVIVDIAWGWKFWLLLAEIMCRLVFILLVGIVVSETSKKDTAVTNHLGKFDLIWVFYIVFFVYSCIDLVCGVVGRDWGKVSEIASLVMYMVMFLVFIPSQKTQYFIPYTPLAPVPEVEIGCRV